MATGAHPPHSGHPFSGPSAPAEPADPGAGGNVGTRPELPQIAHAPGDAQELWLNILGGCVLIRFAHERCREEVARNFSCPAEKAGGSPEVIPDVIVECDLEEMDNELIRPRSTRDAGTPLAGVRVRVRGEMESRPWLAASPPLPPLAEAPFKDRFVALHAAALRKPDGYGIAIIGPSNSGKTTCALALGRRAGFAFLGDEMTYVHCRTSLAEPFPQSVGLSVSSTEKVSVPATELFPRVARRPVELTGLVFLKTTAEDVSGQVEQLDPAEALTVLMSERRDACSSHDEAVAALEHLARNVPAVRLRHSDYRSLPALLDAIL